MPEVPTTLEKEKKKKRKTLPFSNKPNDAQQITQLKMKKRKEHVTKTYNRHLTNLPV